MEVPRRHTPRLAHGRLPAGQRHRVEPGDPLEGGEVEPQHLAPNDAMVFHQTIATCAPEQIGEAAEIKVTARFLDARSFKAKEVASSLFIGAAVAKPGPQLEKGAAIFQYAEALKLLRDSAGSADADAARKLALASLSDAEASNPGDKDLAEIRSVLELL